VSRPNLPRIDAYVKRNEWQRNWINRGCRKGSVRMMSIFGVRGVKVIATG